MSDGWAMKSIGELCEAPKLRKAEVGTNPYIEIGDVDVVSKLVSLKDKPAVKGSVLAPANSLLVSRVRPTRGAITLLGGAQAVSSAFLALRPRAGTNLELLFYWLAYSVDFRTYLEGAQIGSLYPSVREEDVLKYRMNYPSDPAVQQQIVRLLDEAFEGIAKAKANLEKNLQNAKALFESQLQSALTQGADQWETRSISDVCTFSRGLTYAKTDEVGLSKNIVLRATNIDLASHRLVYDELKYLSETVAVPEAKRVKKDSLIICMASGSKSHLGKVALIEEDSGHAFGGFMGMLTPTGELVPKFLFRLMTSRAYRDFIDSISDGANINNLTFDKLSVLSLPIPPLSEQGRIVANLDALEMSTRRLAETYTAKIRAGDALQVSILSQAFSGNLKAA